MYHNQTDEELAETAKKHLKDAHPKDYQAMQSDGSLNKWSLARATATREYANDLQTSGMGEQEAWNLAIRQELLETESD